MGDENDPIALLVYTSGRTGAPKGAIYPESRVAAVWGGGNTSGAEPNGGIPAITVNFLPMSHAMGRLNVLYGTLAAGGTAYSAPRSDLSTLFDDLALVRPTLLSFVPRIWDMLYQEYSRRVGHLLTQGEEHAAVEDDVLVDMRHNMLGGRHLVARTASAPMPPN